MQNYVLYWESAVAKTWYWKKAKDIDHLRKALCKDAIGLHRAVIIDVYKESDTQKHYQEKLGRITVSTLGMCEWKPKGGKGVYAINPKTGELGTYTPLWKGGN